MREVRSSSKYPDNWGETDSDGGASFAPVGGVVQTNSGQGALAYGMIVSVTPRCRLVRTTLAHLQMRPSS